VLHTLLVLLSQTVEKFERQTTASAFVAMNGGGEDNHVGAKHLLYESDGDSCGFINHEKLSLSQLAVILRLDVLNSLSMVLEYIDADDGVVEIGVS